MFSSIGEYIGLGNSFYSGINKLKDNLDKASTSVADLSLSIFNKARKIAKYSFKNSILDISLEQYQNQRAKEVLEKAKSRNGAKSNKQVTQYHESIEYSSKNKKGIYQSHKASGKKPKKLVILLMGNLQSPEMSQSKAGMLKIYNQLKEDDKHDLLLCRVGDSYQDLKHKLCISNDPSLNTDVVYEHISNLIEDRSNSKGSFKNYQKPKNIDIVGFSWGAGVQKKLESRFQKLTSQESARTVSIDAIEYGCENFGDALCQKPSYSSQHLNIYQNNEYSLNGEKNCKSKGCDQFIDVNEIDKNKPNHSQIDDSKVVQKKILDFLNS